MRELVSLDASGEAVWHYGREDIAGDGLTSFASDEASADLRSVYAKADRTRLWLRAYVGSEEKPTKNVVAFFFADADDRSDTGGPAFGAPLYAAWSTDATSGGYEHALGVRGDGTLLGLWSWNAKEKAWAVTRTSPGDVSAEIGRDEDPIRIGTRVHGYLQVDVQHALFGLAESCAANLFVRTWYEGEAPRLFGDDASDAFACVPRVDKYGDPVVIRSASCAMDSDCPNDGRCRDKVCLFAYACGTNADCRSDERCASGSCVKVVNEACSSSADCGGLVCASSACVPCADNTCAADLACSPNGTCVDPRDYEPGAVSGGGADAGLNADAGMVRGGAFHCSTTHDGQRGLGAFILWLTCAALVGRRASRERSV